MSELAAQQVEIAKIMIKILITLRSPPFRKSVKWKTGEDR